MTNQSGVYGVGGSRRLSAVVFRLLYKLYRLQWFLSRPVVIGVRVMLFKEGSILLVKHSYQDGWLVPGGGVKRGETPEQAARRECREEVGAKIGPMDFLGVYTQFVEHKSDHILLFASQEFTLTPKRDFEIERVAFFNCHRLPPDLMPGSRRRIEEFLQGQLVPRAGIW